MNADRARKLASRRKQIRQMMDALDRESMDLERLVEQLSEENGRLRLALNRATQYNGTSPQDDSRS